MRCWCCPPCPWSVRTIRSRSSRTRSASPRSIPMRYLREPEGCSITARTSRLNIDELRSTSTRSSEALILPTCPSTSRRTSTSSSISTQRRSSVSRSRRPSCAAPRRSSGDDDQDRGYPRRCMTEPLAAWHDFNVSVVTASAALLGLLFVALSIHIRTLMATRNAELRAVARTVFLGYVIALGIGFLALVPQGLGPFGYEVLALVVFAAIPFTFAARAGLRATGIGYDRRVTIVQFIAGIGLFATMIAAALAVASGDERALFVVGGVEVLSLLWGVFNTYELIFRVQLGEG